jgi:homoserine dehydrogenase
VVADVIDLAQRLPGNAAGRPGAAVYEQRPILPLGAVGARYYVRLVAADRPGVIAAIARIFGDHDISLASVIQKEDVPSGEGESGDRYAEIVFMTHQSNEANMQDAREAIAALPSVARVGSLIRVED